MCRLLFIGLGSIGRKHLQTLGDLGRSFEVHAYRSGNSSSPTPDGVTEHRQLSAALEADPEIAFITNPTAHHVETARRCAEAGCDLFIEKPLSHKLDGVDALIDTVRSNDLVACVACPLRYHPVITEAEQTIESGDIGSILSVRAYSGSYLPDWRPKQDYRKSYSASRALGGGVVLDLIHEIDYVYSLFGKVADSVGRTAHVSNLEIETEDLAEIILEMETGAMAQIHLDYVRRNPRRTLEVVGTAGNIRGDFVENTLTMETDDTERTRSIPVDDREMYRRQLTSFLDAVDQRGTCQSTLEEAKRVLQIALDVRDNDP